MIETEVIFVYEDGTKSQPMKAIVSDNPHYKNKDNDSNGFNFNLNEEDNNYVL